MSFLGKAMVFLNGGVDLYFIIAGVNFVSLVAERVYDVLRSR